MTHLPSLVHDLALILSAGCIVTILCRILRQPVVLGYILVGFFVGPNFSFLPTISDSEGIKIWAEIGVIFLLFGLGLEFSFRRLLRVGGAASVTAFFEVVVMLGLGFLTGRVLGWNQMDSLFLGGILSISSTTIIVRAFSELKLKNRGFASLVLGILVVEDLVAVLLLVLLTTVAISRQFQGGELLLSLLKLIFFLALWFISGIYFIPHALKKLKPFFSDEFLVVLALGLCFLMVILATRTGFSPALGAFIMGSILAETTEAHRIERLVQPIQNLFGMIFFISVGMLLDPKILSQHISAILLITIITVFGKVFATTLGALISGRSLKHSIQSGFSLAQIGEFSFIIATLGLSLNVTSAFLYPIAVAVSVLTTFLTPYLIQMAEPIYKKLESRLPRWLNNALVAYSSKTIRISSETGWLKFLKHLFMRESLKKILSRVKNEFLKNLAEEQSYENKPPLLAPWDAHITEFTIPAESPVIGQSLIDLKIKEKFGVIVALIRRGNKTIHAPARTDCLYPHDQIYILGTDEQISRFKNFIEPEENFEHLEVSNYELQSMVLSAQSQFLGKTIRDSGIREAISGLIVGIERQGQRILNPDSALVLTEGDFLWIVGDSRKVEEIQSASILSESS